ncbi:DNA polymerase I [Jingyaoa shaoxingensis]|uniref:DNA polymerase I n=1 Tax=Jingyaoa shaoxingensis TaxID=2763671 RepID=A0ABR7N7K2_9FIRM|nr:DNA polymerase I [Jingyaoa shaoxingensis]MBC8572375.1 DNA polymerase I [Jingyaoa shaoxingensis]
MEKIVLIDGHSILNRAYYGVPDLTNSDGLHTNAVYGFLNIMFKILDEEKPDYFAVAFDLKAPTFRHKMYEQYKGTRKPMQEELRQQVPVIKEMLEAMQVPLMMLEGYEADDLLGTVAKKAEADGLEAVVVSGDRDLLQLATDHIMIRIPKTKKGGTEIEDYHTADVIEKYQVTPIQIIELKALMGDSSDNIPGIPGVGEKTATKLVAEYGCIENAYAHVDEIKPNKARESLRDHYDMAQMSKELATINIHSPFELDMEKARMTDLYTKEAFELCKKLEFKNMLSRFEVSQEEHNHTAESFHMTSDLTQAQEWLEKLKKEQQIGFYLLSDEKQEFCGLAVSGKEETFFFCNQGFLTEQYLTSALEELIETAEQAVTLQLKRQLRFLQLSESAKKKILDGAISAYLLNPLKGEYPYEDLAKDYMKELIPGAAELLGKIKISDLNAEDERLSLLACYQSHTALHSMSVMLERLQGEEMERLFEEMEMPLVYTLAGMEKEGIRADAGILKEYAQKLGEKMQELEQEIYAEAGDTFNINSPKQLGNILFEKLQLPGSKKTKSGYSTAADILENLAPDYPIVQKVLDYRQVAKLKSTYADGLAAFIGEDGRIHGTFHQTVTATGRISSTDPNLQNIPIRTEMGRLFRKVFLPKEGCIFVDADYSQIELRVLAALSGDEALIHAFQNNIDIHTLTASQVFHTPLDQVTPLQRRNAKAVNFGIVYGISAFGLSQDLKISRKEASEYINNYFASYPKIKEFLDQAVVTAKEQGYIATYYHRRRPVPELTSSNFMQRSFGERIAMNSPIQGTAADIIKLAMIRVDQRLHSENLKARLVLQVHDELLVEAPVEEEARVREILHEEMMGVTDFPVEMDIDIQSGSDWYEAH